MVIVGSGFSGIGMGVALQRAGIDDFVILEKAGEVGGVWRDNTYPGCECDVPSHLYSFSFEPNPRWRQAFSAQPDIAEYLQRVADTYGLREHIRFGTAMSGEHWDDERQVWRVSTDTDEEYTCRFVVNSTRALFVPMLARLKGIRAFAGETFHSAQWNHDYDLSSKRVAVVGTGASAIQIVPAIAPRVASLTLFQRTAPWVLPKPQRSVPGWLRRLFAAAPIVQQGYRSALYWARELGGVPVMRANPLALRRGERRGRRHIERQVADPELRRKLTPDYRFGCKRVLLSNDYYPALSRDNVNLVTDGIEKVLPHAVVDASGTEHPVDAIIFGTGFQGALQKVKIIGRDGRSLWREWVRDGAVSLRGISVAGFPNMFFLHGPNSGTAHNSMVFMIEAQARFVVDAIRLVRRRSAASIDARPQAQERFQERIQQRLATSVWVRGGCTSWYLDDRGVNRTMWPGGSWRYRLQTRRVDPREFDLTPAPEFTDQLSPEVAQNGQIR